MCRCTPSIKSPWCNKCKTPLDNLELYSDMNQTKASVEVKTIIKTMNGLSEEGYRNKYLNDPHFHNGVNALVNLVTEGSLRLND